MRRITMTMTMMAMALTACGGGGSGSSATYSVGGSVSGLGAGQAVTLQNGGADDLTVSANGAFVFATPLPGGSTYVVTALRSRGFSCTVKNDTGVVSANVTNVAVTCISLPAYTIGGTISGLGAGKSIVLVNNGVDSLTLSANGTFTFATPVWSGTPYVVSVASQPSGQYCDASIDGIAMANVTSVSVSCHDPFTVGGTVSGLAGQHLQISLDASVLDIGANGSYVFPAPVMPSHNGHAVTVTAQPQAPAQHCIVQNPYFVYAPPNSTGITNVNIVCSEFAYVADAAVHGITAYSIDPATGALTALGPSVGAGQSPVAIASASDKQYLYVTDGVGNGVSAYAVDANTGALMPVPGSPFATDKSPGAIVAKSETWCTQPGRGGHRCSVRPVVYVANTGAGSVAIYAVDQATGALTLASSMPLLSGNPGVMATGDDDLLLYVADSAASSEISAFQSTGGGMFAAAPPLNSQGKITSMALGLGQGFLYAANASGATASILRYSIQPYGGGPNTMPGALGILPSYPLANCSYLVSDRTGGHIYATAGASLYGFGIDPNSGALHTLPGFPVVVGMTGDSIQIDPSNQFLYVVASKAGKVAGYRVDAVTGSLVAPIPGSPFAVGGSSIAFATL
jgi:6-phosphogluconolactonase (cycloisomerase 2 family)